MNSTEYYQRCSEFLCQLEAKLDEIDELEIGAIEQIQFGVKLFGVAFDVSDEKVAKLVWDRVKPKFLYWIKKGWFIPNYNFDEILYHFPQNDSGYSFFIRYFMEIMKRDSPAFRNFYNKEIKGKAK